MSNFNAEALASALPGFFTVADASDLPEDNQFTISSAGLEEVGQGPKAEEKPVLSFAACPKKLVLNKARCQQLAALFGKDDLVGKNIRLTTATLAGINQVVIVSSDS